MAAFDDILGGPGAASAFSQNGSKPGGNHPETNPAGVTGRVQAPGLAGVDTKPEVDNTSLIGLDTDESGKVVAQKPMTYAQMYDMMNPNRPETAEERARREKREKSEAVLAAVGDGISALSNLWFTSQYSPNAYDPSKGMSATTKDRWDKLRQEREANRRAYSDGYMRAMAMDEAKDREDRNWRHTLEREKIADDRYEAQAKLEEKKAKLDEQLRLHQITAAEYKAEQERISALYAEDTEQLKQDNLRAGVQQKKAAAGASHASANASNARADYYRSGGGGKSGPTLQLEDDEPMRFGDDKDYDRAVMRLAPVYGVPVEVEEVTEWEKQYNPQTKKWDRVPKKTRKVARPVKDIAADIERKAEERKKQKSSNNTMPGVGENGGSTNTMPGVK